MNNLQNIGIAVSPRPTAFGPLLFCGRLEEGLATANQQGLQDIELSLRSVNDIDLNTLLPLLEKFSMKISAIATGQACLFDSLCLSASDDLIREKAVAHFKGMVLLARNLGAEAVIIGGIRGKLGGSLDEQAKQQKLGIDSIRKCAEFAEKQQKTILIEPINRYEMNWIHTVSDGLELLEKINNPSIKLLLDTFHMNIEEANMIQAFRLAGDQLGYIHFADNNRHAPGQGQTDFHLILKVLKEINYQGPIVSEILPIPDDLTALKNTAAFWKEMGFIV